VEISYQGLMVNERDDQGHLYIRGRTLIEQKKSPDLSLNLIGEASMPYFLITPMFETDGS